jgi:hypothetical protein
LGEIAGVAPRLRNHTRRIRSERGIAAIAAVSVVSRAAWINLVGETTTVPPPGVSVLPLDELFVPLAILVLLPLKPPVVLPLPLFTPLEMFLPILVAPIIVAPCNPDGREGDRCYEHQDESHGRSPTEA